VAHPDAVYLVLDLVGEGTAQAASLPLGVQPNSRRRTARRSCPRGSRDTTCWRRSQRPG
jgi:hypothetical protein